MESIEINGRAFQVIWELSRNRNAWGRLKGDRIVISIPSRWPAAERERSGKDLLRRMVRSIEKGGWKPGSNKKVEFSHGQKVVALGNEFEIALVPSSRFGSRKARDGRIEVRVAGDHPKGRELASALARKRIVEAVMPSLEERVDALNQEHFQAALGRLSVRDNTSRWGSCSPRGDISLNFRLLFLPDGILDYVIVHELAHTKYRSHGPRFWGLVEKAIPDHKERRKWLRENGWKFPSESRPREGQQKLAEFSEC